MKCYTDILKEYAEEKDVNLKRAFVDALIPTSTYYRVMYGQDIRYATAKRVYERITKISSLQ